MSPFRHHRPRCLAITLALVALVVRLLLPGLHHHHGGERHDYGARDGAQVASSCGCASTPTTTAWWHEANPGSGGEADSERAPTPAASASIAASDCLACAAELLPLAAAAAPAFAAAPPTFVRARAPTPLAGPRCAAVRARHPCRAPPTTAA